MQASSWPASDVTGGVTLDKSSIPLLDDFISAKQQNMEPPSEVGVLIGVCVCVSLDRVSPWFCCSYKLKWLLLAKC